MPLLEVRGLSRRGHFQDVSFSLWPGEILGLTGLIGSGRTELALALFGLNPPDSGPDPPEREAGAHPLPGGRRCGWASATCPRTA